ncbi:hypothetical protein [Roseateles sp. PN1]|uniref:hypothetical protein n=1 Tax=Roseateles sp. PN1 TaxID=3137372 RepID=UPI00313A1B58
MQRFFDTTFRPFFLLTGAITAGAAGLLFLPAWTLKMIFQLDYVPAYTVLAQHWGAMVGLVGLAMILAALRSEWRTPILIFVGLEKACLVLLVLMNWGQPAAAGFVGGALMDVLVSLYILGYFWARPRSVRG